MTENYAFPWGVHIGNLIEGKESLSVCLPSETGGFCVLFDKDSKIISDNFVENVALQLFNVLPANSLSVDICDFDHNNRFMTLLELKNEGLYSRSTNTGNAKHKFEEFEEISRHRHQLLSSFTPTISEYNKDTEFLEKYHLLIINLKDYSDHFASERRISAFFDSPYTAGFYVIAFGNKESVVSSKDKAVIYLLERFPIINIRNKQVLLNDQVFPYTKLIKNYRFDYLNENKTSALKNILGKFVKEENTNADTDFLSVPIGKTADGRNDVYFHLGSKSKSYHAFITGMTGMGKSTLLNNIILNIAENYTAQEIRLYLMDYKQGIEFSIFKNHPNCEKLFLDNEDTDAATQLLESFVIEIRQRSQLFQSVTTTHVNDIDAYNAIHKNSPLHRIILIIDEVQRLFVYERGEYNKVQKFENLLTTVAQQGRAVGLHFILSTQSLRNAHVPDAIMAQIKTRLSFQLREARDSEKIFTDHNTAAIGLKEYQLIYNNDSGQKEANVLCNASKPREIEQTIEQIRLTRSDAKMITPIIVQSQKNTVRTPSQMPENDDALQTFSTSEEDELLKKMAASPEFSAYFKI